MMFRRCTEKMRFFFQRARLRTQLLITVNLFVAIVMSGYLYLDFQQRSHAQLLEKTISLRDEARTIDAAIQELRKMGDDAVQRHINTICATMNAGESPGHTIEVTLDGTRFVSQATTHLHDHSSPWSELVSGVSTTGDITVRIGERRAPMVAQVRRDTAARLGAGVGMAIVGTLILNLLLLHLVTRPVERTVHAVREVGQGNLGTTVDVSANYELTQLAHEVSKMSIELSRRNHDRNAQIDRARRLQSHLIPRHIAHDEIGIAIEFHPADEIAGDFVDVLECPNGDTLLCVADVVGHGIHAAMGSAVLKALLLTIDLNDSSPANMLESINERFYQTTLPEDFASMILMRVSGDAQHLVYASAGHELGYHRHVDGSYQNLDSTGTVLGVDPSASYDDIKLELHHDDLIVLLSDGVSETFDTDQNILGRDAITRVIEHTGHTNPSAVAKEIIDIAVTHRGDSRALDDMTVLVLCVTLTDTQSTLDACVDSSHHTPAGATPHNSEI